MQYDDDNQRDLWFKDGLSFQCTSCGNCCTGGPGYVWISDEEIDRLAAHLQMDRADVLRKYCRKLDGRISLKEKRPNAQGEYDCIFLKEVPAECGTGDGVKHSRRICTIYPVRPLQCRTWPFWEGNLATERSWELAARRCPGMNRGNRYPLKQIIERRDAKDWPE